MRENDQTYIRRAWEIFELSEKASCTLMETVVRLRTEDSTPLLWLRLAADRRAERMLRLFFCEGDREGFALAAELWRSALENRT